MGRMPPFCLRWSLYERGASVPDVWMYVAWGPRQIAQRATEYQSDSRTSQ